MRTLSVEQQFAVAGPVTEPQYLVEITLDEPRYLSTRSVVVSGGNTYTTGDLQLGPVRHDGAELLIANHDDALTAGAEDGAFLRQPVRILWAYGVRSVPTAEPLQADTGFDSADGWTLGDGWAIDPGEAYALDPAPAEPIEGSMTPLAIGEDYTVTLVLDAVHTGGVSVECDGVEVISSQTSAGTYTGAYVPASETETLSIIPSADFQGDISRAYVAQDGAVDTPGHIVRFEGIISATPEIGEWIKIECAPTPPKLYPFQRLRPPIANFLPSAGYVLAWDGAVLRIEG